jgi:hypothetical protein
MGYQECDFTERGLQTLLDFVSGKESIRWTGLDWEGLFKNEVPKLVREIQRHRQATTPPASDDLRFGPLINTCSECDGDYLQGHYDHCSRSQHSLAERTDQATTPASDSASKFDREHDWTTAQSEALQAMVRDAEDQGLYDRPELSTDQATQEDRQA